MSVRIAVLLAAVSAGLLAVAGVVGFGLARGEWR